MILIEICIPGFNRSFDFQVDETEPVGNIIIEISEMIGNLMKSENIEHDKFLLCSEENQEMIPKYTSLQKYGIKNGDRLLLI